MATDWRQRDQEHVEKVLTAFVPSPSPSQNWRGYIAGNRIPVLANDPKGNPSQPVMFLMARLEYEEIQGDFGGGDPYRTGSLAIAIYQEIGAGDAKAIGIGGVLDQLKAVLAADSGTIVWMPDLSRPAREGQQRGTPYWVSGESVPFAAG